MFYDNFISLCEDAGKSPSGMLEELGLSKGSLKRWRTGVKPNNETKKVIADYFGITTKQLMNDLGAKKAPEVNADNERFKKYEYYIKDLSPSEELEVYRYIDLVKSSRKQN